MPGMSGDAMAMSAGGGPNAADRMLTLVQPMLAVRQLRIVCDDAAGDRSVIAISP